MTGKTTQLTITVGPDGAVKSDFLNFTGTACVEAGQHLHRLLAAFGLTTEVTAFIPKPELSASPAMQTLVQTQQLPEGVQ